MAQLIRSRNATVARVNASATAVTLRGANNSSLGATVYNDSSATLYVKCGAGASASDFTVALAPNTTGVGGYWEVPDEYDGLVTGAWSSATGGAQVTEFIP
jgi:hypothetical protein